MSFERFKKAQQEKKSYKEEVVNPYKDFVKKGGGDEKPLPVSTQPDENVLRKEGHDISQYHSLRRELNELRDDVASLYAMFMGVELSDLNLPDLRTFINHFRMDERHILNHKKKFKP